MDESVKTYNNREEIDKISSRLAPIKLNLNNKYKVKYPENHSTKINPE